MSLPTLLKDVRVIPVITIERLEHALPLAKALVAGGLNCLEITLRTEVAFDAMKAIIAGVPEAIVGVGTVLDPAQLKGTKRAGAQFAVSPGITPTLVREAEKLDLPYLPGTATLSEIMAARELGLRTVKFFPAEINGGAKALKAFEPLFTDMTFVPTGGITPDNMADYLKLKQVLAVGGSWMVKSDLIEGEKWDEITKLAKAAHMAH